jgi:hypothetical protein
MARFQKWRRFSSFVHSLNSWRRDVEEMKGKRERKQAEQQIQI